MWCLFNIDNKARELNLVEEGKVARATSSFEEASRKLRGSFEEASYPLHTEAHYAPLTEPDTEISITASRQRALKAAGKMLCARLPARSSL
jgi:hypothetical protein